MEQLLSDYQRLRAELGERALPPMETGQVAVEPETFTDPAALEARIAALAPTAGWYLAQSRQAVFRDGWPGEDSSRGFLLAAEGVLDDGALLVHQDGAGGWRLLRYRHQDGEGLTDEITLRAHGGGTLRYRRYWQMPTAPDDAEQHTTGPEQSAAILIGVEE